MNSPVSNFPGLGVVILAAGASSRMGRPKLLLRWGDTSIVGHLIRQWRELQADQIVIVGRSGDRELDAELNRLDFPAADRIENPQPRRGMFSSIQCAANWDGWAAEITVRAIVLGDQPHLRLDTLRRLLAFHREHSDAVCQPEFGGHARHPVLLPAHAFVELKQTSASTLKDFLKLTSCRSLGCRMEDSGLALDLDTPEDYQRAQSLEARSADQGLGDSGFRAAKTSVAAHFRRRKASRPAMENRARTEGSGTPV